MYTILITDSNELVTSIRERVVQRSKMVDDLHFLMAPTYKGKDMTKFTATMEYILPVSRELHTDTLAQSKELYKGQIEYKLPFDTNFTKEAGDIELKLTFTCVEMDAEGVLHQYVRKTTSTCVKIVPVEAWSNIVPDSALEALDQRLLVTEAMIKELSELSQILDDTKADNIKYDTTDSTIQLVANGMPIGDKIVISTAGQPSVNAIQKMLLSDDGRLIAIYSDGTEELVGKVDNKCPGVYIPSLAAPDKLTFTLQQEATEQQIVIDIDRSNEWNTEGSTNYIWETLI